MTRLRQFEWICQVISPLPGVVPPARSCSKTQAEWQSVIQIGSTHLVLPQLYVSLHAKGLWQLLPEDVAEALGGFYDLNRIYIQNIRDQLIAVTDRLNLEGIVPVWLKGATCLLESDWRQSARMMLDLDFCLSDPDRCSAALSVMEADGYSIPRESLNGNDNSGHHYLRRMKEGMPAGIEIHRDLVEVQAQALLGNQDALGRVVWCNWENRKIGTLSKLDQCLHSYIQCTEMNQNGMRLGKLRMMKACDFINRYLALDNDAIDALHELLRRSPVDANARMFFTYLEAFYGLQSPFAADDAFVKGVRVNYAPGLWSNPRTMLLKLHLKDLFEKFRTGSFGPPNQWLQKGWHIAKGIVAYRPDL